MEKTVLLVEDDVELRDLLQDILEDEGYDVVPADDGRQALEYLRTTSGKDEAPSLMILDLMMPHVNGWEVLDAMEADPRIQVPVIVVSATGTAPEDVSAGTVFFQKPFDLDRLMETVHERC
jgi:DNA-binding response OmpR family regulator